MKIENQPRDDHQVTLIVEFDSGTLEKSKQRAAREFARRIKVPGFRPGKAPYPVILRQVGEAALVEDALEHIIDDNYATIIQESGIKPYGAGSLEKVESMEPLVLEFVVPLEPLVTLGDYQSISRPYELDEINDADVDEVLENLRDQHAVLEPAERPAQEGDVVSVRLSGERVNPGEDQESLLIPESSYQFLVRTEAAAANDEWPFPGFSRQLIGLNRGDTGSVSHVFAEDYDYESLRGAEGQYSYEIEDVKSRQLPVLDDEFAKTLGEYADLASVRVEIQQGLQQQTLENYNQIYDDAIVAELIERSTILYPPQMVESEENTVVENFKRRMEQQGSDLDVYLKSRNMDLAALKEEARPVAEKHLKRSLVLLELAKAEKIEVSEADLQSETMRTLRSLNQSLSPEDVRNLSDERVMSNLVGNIMLEMTVERAQARLRQIARGETPASEEIIEAAGATLPEEPTVSESPVDEPMAVEINNIVPTVEVEEETADEANKE